MPTATRDHSMEDTMKCRAPGFPVLLVALMSCVEPVSETENVALAPSYALSEEPLATIGGSDEGDGHVLHWAESALRLSDGRIVVGDVGTRELRWFDGRGEYLQAVGGSGEGPGEFDRLRAIMRSSGDTVVAWDWGLKRLNLVSPDGELSAITIRSWIALYDAFQRYVTEGVVSRLEVFPVGSDRMLVQPSVSSAYYESEGVTRDTVRFALLDRATEEWVEIGPFPRLERFAHDRVGTSLPFGKNFRFAAGARAIFMGSTDNPLIQVRSPETGEIVGEVVLPGEPRPVTAADIEAYRSPRESLLSSWLDAVPWPTTFPIFSELKVGGGGLLWVKLYQTPTDALQEWWGFEQTGELEAKVTLDGDREVMDLDRGYVLVRIYDELEREEIRLYELVRSST